MLVLYFFRDRFGLLGFHIARLLATSSTLRFTGEPALDWGMQRGGHMLRGFFEKELSITSYVTDFIIIFIET